jgi:hypothetical protein
VAFQDPVLLRTSSLGLEHHAQGSNRLRGVPEEDEALAGVSPQVGGGDEKKI